MKWSTLIAGIFMLGFIGVGVIFLFQNITTGNENDYYLLKEVTEASMFESIDIPFYRNTGNIKIVKEKFVENFTRRFAESISFFGKQYKISFYDIMENPPKVSIVIDNDLGEQTIYNNTMDFSVVNKLDAILEYANVNSSNGLENNNIKYEKKSIKKTYNALLPIKDGNINASLSIKIPDELNVFFIKNISIANVKILNDNDASSNDFYNSMLEMNSYYNNYDEISFTNNIKDISSSNNLSLDFYNCGLPTSRYACNDLNKHFISIKGSGNNKLALFKYEITWSFEQLKFM